MNHLSLANYPIQRGKSQREKSQVIEILKFENSSLKSKFNEPEPDHILTYSVERQQAIFGLSSSSSSSS